MGTGPDGCRPLPGNGRTTRSSRLPYPSQLLSLLLFRTDPVTYNRGYIRDEQSTVRKL